MSSKTNSEIAQEIVDQGSCVVEQDSFLIEQFTAALDESELEKAANTLCCHGVEGMTDPYPNDVGFFKKGARYAARNNLRLAIESVKLTDAEVLDRAIAEAAVLKDPDKRALVKAAYTLGALESFAELKKRLGAV